MTEKVSDEMLMAYIDGELDAETADAVGRRMDADPVLARRAMGLRDSRILAREAYDDIVRGKPPVHLVDAVLRKTRPATARASMRSVVGRVALPLAASVAIVAGVGGYLAGRSTDAVGVEVLGGGALAEALSSMRTGEGREISIGGAPFRLTALAAYEVDGGLCRTFEARTNADEGILGVGCRYDGNWHVDAAVAVGGGDAMTPASSAATAVLDAFLDSVGARGPLAPDEENQSP